MPLGTAGEQTQGERCAAARIEHEQHRRRMRRRVTRWDVCRDMLRRITRDGVALDETAGQGKVLRRRGQGRGEEQEPGQSPTQAHRHPPRDEMVMDDSG